MSIIKQMLGLPDDADAATVRASVEHVRLLAIARRVAAEQPPAVIQVDVHVPEQPAPIVNLTAPDVVVNVPEQPAPIVNIDNLIELPPEGRKKVKITRDPAGRIIGATIEGD